MLCMLNNDLHGAQLNPNVKEWTNTFTLDERLSPIWNLFIQKEKFIKRKIWMKFFATFYYKHNNAYSSLNISNVLT